MIMLENAIKITAYKRSKSNFIEFKSILFAPFLDYFDDDFILNLIKIVTLGEDSTDFKIAAASIKC